MTAVFTIAWRDMKAYITSMKGAFIFFVFLLLLGVFFYSFIGSYVEMTQRAPMFGGEAPNLEQLLRAMFYNTHFVLILLIPMVTMGSFSDEKRSQALRLLQTAPISATQIVLGKFLATTGIMAAILLASLVFPLYLVFYGNPDPGVIISSYLGLLLLIGSQLAFGMWVSSMTNSSIVAAVVTVFGLFLLLILNWIAPQLGGGDMVTDVVKYMASTDHLDVFFKGIISVKDIAYFLCFAGLFLFFTNVVLDSQRWR